MYTILALLSILVLVVGGIITYFLAINQSSEQYKGKTRNRFMNLIWIYVLGVGGAVVGLLLYIFL